MDRPQGATRMAPPTTLLLPVHPDDPFPPFIPGYQVQYLLGEGGMARVWLVCRVRDGRRFAAKVPNKGPRPEERFRREARQSRPLRHANVVRIEEVIDTPELLCCILSYYEGGNLERVLETEGQLSIRRAIRIT